MSNSLSIPCPACQQQISGQWFYRSENHPANSVILCQSPDEATTLKRGDIELVYCDGCGFIFNKAYDPGLCRYDQNYEESQAYSRVFNQFSSELAAHLIETHQLRNKTILEIGCGKGDFLNLICRMGNNRGVGYDPSYVAERSQTMAGNAVTFYRECFPQKYDGLQPDCVICKMTLEHIPQVHQFLTEIRKAIIPGNNAVVFFQVPDCAAILEGARFWDIYYEHCSYFTRESLSNLFQLCGFRIVSITGGYDSQYLMIEARPDDTLLKRDFQPDCSSGNLVRSFAATVAKHVELWRQRLRSYHEKNKTVALWGGGSKAVAFLTHLDSLSPIHWVVDINPHKQGTYLPGSGYRISAPEELVALRPDIVLAMNPVYLEEIHKELDQLGVDCEILPVTDIR